MSDVERLRAVAEAAKADSDGVGDWSRGPADCYGNTPTVQTVIPPDPEPFTVAAGCSDANAEHIATFDPTTVLALLHRLAAAQSALARAWALRPTGEREWRNQGRSGSTPTVDYSDLRAALAPEPTDSPKRKDNDDE